MENPTPDRFENFQGNPGFQFLEVHSPSSQAMLVLGYVTSPIGQPSIQTWYDAEQRLLRLQNGFLINLTGVEKAVASTDYVWPERSGEVGPWLPVAKTYSQPAQQLFEKTVDLGYRPVPGNEVDVRNSVLRKRLLTAQAKSIQSLLWYQESDATVPNGSVGYMRNLYAFNQDGVPVYGSYCLARGECMEWLFRTSDSLKP